MYVGTGLAFGILCIVFAEHDIESKWLVLLFETCLVFGVVIAQQRAHWPFSVFWIASLALFVIRGFGAILLVQRVPQLKAAWAGTALLIETAVYITMLGTIVPQLLSVEKSARKHGRHRAIGTRGGHAG